MIRETSRTAFAQIKENGLLSKRRLEVYEIINCYGPLIGADVSRHWKGLHGTTQQSENVRNRITELVKMGCVEIAGQRKDINSGMMVSLFRVNDNLPTKLPPQESKTYIIKTLKKKIERLESRIDYYKEMIGGENG